MRANGNGRDGTRFLPGSASVSKYTSTRPGSAQPLALCVIAAAAMLTSLLVLHSLLLPLGPHLAGNFGRGLTVAALAGVLVGILSYIAIQLFDRLSRSGLCQLLAGEDLTSGDLGALGLLGLALGGSVALCHGLAITLLPLLPLYPLL